jgi:alpha-L-arabinofuranosidase
MAPEPNSFGTHEFIAFARAIGAEPYFAGNVGSGTVAELRDWVEYCNHPAGSTLSDERRANGAAEPFGVRLWGIGNENWGCGGNLTPEAYAEEYVRYRHYAFPFGGTEVTGVACGPNSADWSWTRRFLEQLTGSSRCRLGSVQAFAAHYYCGTAGTATEFDDSQWLELLTRAVAVEGIITGHRSIMDSFDPERKIQLFLDEWGAWHPVEAGKPKSGLYQQNTMRDALVAALSLDIFHNHADKLAMANIAQLINVLQSLLLVEGDRCITTPTYHVFAMYQAHRGGTAVRLVNASEVISHGEAAEEECRERYLDRSRAELHLVSGSASISGDRLCVTVVNAHPSEPADLDLQIAGGRSTVVESVRLSHADPRAHNTFVDPDAVVPAAPASVPVDGGRLRTRLEPGSITRFLVPA